MNAAIKLKDHYIPQNMGVPYYNVQEKLVIMISLHVNRLDTKQMLHICTKKYNIPQWYNRLQYLLQVQYVINHTLHVLLYITRQNIMLKLLLQCIGVEICKCFYVTIILVSNENTNSSNPCNNICKWSYKINWNEHRRAKYSKI